MRKKRGCDESRLNLEFLILRLFLSHFQGSETSAVTNCFCILLLAMHKEVQVSILVASSKLKGTFRTVNSWSFLNSFDELILKLAKMP